MKDFFSSFIEQPFDGLKSWLFFSPMLYSAFYFLAFFFEDFSGEKTALILAAYALYLFLYTAIYLDHKRALIYIAGIILLCIGISSILFSSYALLWSSSYFCGYLYKRKAAIALLAVNIVSAVVASQILSHGNVLFFLLSSILPLVSTWFFGSVGQYFKLDNIIKKQKDQQIESLAQIAERERIARDMHDLLGHSLTCIALKSELAAKLLNTDNIEKAKTEIEEVSELSRTALQEVREAIGNYKKRSFNEQIKSLVAKLHSADIQVSTDLANLKLNAETETALTLVATEAVTNILRHSRADKVHISLIDKYNKLVFTISDNGQIKKLVEGNGIQGMRERIEKLGGKIQFQIKNGMTTEISLDESIAC
ncbi:sensor histidine kinase [Agaribacterium sp. ZY112]|uniref:sensor histidine kinase n=1 Tax=Agaribacterium sp. ZY112 TaxID=3233574 RepID=UPI003524BA6F